MSTEQRGIKKFLSEKWVEICALIFGIAAVLFSWDANRVAREANEIASRSEIAHLQVMDLRTFPLEHRVFASEPTLEDSNLEDIVCKFYLRFANLGGAPTWITSFSVELSFQDEVVKIDSGTINPNASGIANVVSSPLHIYDAYLLDDYLVDLPLPEWDEHQTLGDTFSLFPDVQRVDILGERIEHGIKLPWRIEPYEIKEMFSEIWLTTSQNILLLDQSEAFHGSSLEAISPYLPEIRYTFHTVDGENTISPMASCLIRI